MEDHRWITGLLFVAGTVWVALLTFIGKMLFNRLGTVKVFCPNHEEALRRIEMNEKEIAILRTRSVDKDDFKSMRKEWGDKIDKILVEVQDLKLALVKIHSDANFGKD